MKKKLIGRYLPIDEVINVCSKVFIEDGYVELTNNVCERVVKPFVVQRKVFQTSGSYAGTRYTAKLFSIIQTCLINNINIEKNL